jgi:hypothetical protein
VIPVYKTDIKCFRWLLNLLVLKARDFLIYSGKRNRCNVDQPEKRFMLHDCGDWRRTQRERKFCKHIGALMIEDNTSYLKF